MQTPSEKAPKSKKRSIVDEVSQKPTEVSSAAQFLDNRSEAIQTQKLQEMANNSSKVQQLMPFEKVGNLTEKTRPADDPQAQIEAPVLTQDTIQKKKNNTRLPDTLKSGIENLSGYSMDDVKVHYNSPKPSQLQAHAYAQGTNIHLASGQEKHLPHEAWHVVQQKQGRVKPTLQMKGQLPVNDDAGLEKEADIMGAKAAQLKPNENIATSKASVANPVVQGMYWWAPYAIGVGITGMIGLYAWWSSGKKKPPPNLTDVTFEGEYAKDDMEDAVDKIPKKELELLGINTTETRITSPHHPDLLHAIGTGVKGIKRVESSDKLMSKEGVKYDRQEADRLVKAAGVKKGEGIHKAKKSSGVIGESHDSVQDKAQLVRRLAKKHSGGQRTLYIEILKEMQPVIDLWQKQLLKNPKAKMPVTLSRYLYLLDAMMDKYDVKNDSKKIVIEKDPMGTYTNIVKAAAKAGVRIVGMDSLHAKNMRARGKDPDNYKRAAAMNQSAFEVIKEDQEKNPSEYLVYTGQAHVGKQHYKDHPTLMGLTERLGVPDLGKKHE